MKSSFAFVDAYSLSSLHDSRDLWKIQNNFPTCIVNIIKIRKNNENAHAHDECECACMFAVRLLLPQSGRLPPINFYFVQLVEYCHDKYIHIGSHIACFNKIDFILNSSSLFCVCFYRNRGKGKSKIKLK